MSVTRRMYRVAMLPKFATLTAVTSNPFLTVERDRVAALDVAVTGQQLRAWLSAAPKHTQLAIAIAALSPRLRLDNVLSLGWDRNFTGGALEDLTTPVYIRVAKHKTAAKTRKPLVSPVERTLRTILLAAKTRSGVRLGGDLPRRAREIDSRRREARGRRRGPRLWSGRCRRRHVP